MLCCAVTFRCLQPPPPPYTIQPLSLAADTRYEFSELLYKDVRKCCGVTIISLVPGHVPEPTQPDDDHPLYHWLAATAPTLQCIAFAENSNISILQMDQIWSYPKWSFLFCSFGQTVSNTQFTGFLGRTSNRAYSSIAFLCELGTDVEARDSQDHNNNNNKVHCLFFPST